MHRFMRHLDDLAGLDVHIGTAKRGRAGMQHQAGGRGIIETLRQVIAGPRGEVKREAMCCGGLAPARRPATASSSSSSRSDHAPPGSFHRR